jgi:hypothetical protein
VRERSLIEPFRMRTESKMVAQSSEIGGRSPSEPQVSEPVFAISWSV